MIIERILPDWPAPSNVRAFVTTRAGGVGSGSFASFNLADHVGDDPQTVSRNRELLRAHLPAEPLWLKQVHGTCCIDAQYFVRDVEADAVFSSQPGRICTVLTADCLPVLLCDTAGRVVAAAHAGWRGLAAGIIESTVAAMGVPGKQLMAWLGPAIGPKRFEVGQEVREAFLGWGPQAAAAFVPSPSDKWLCNLYLLAEQRLTAAGVGHIAGGHFCTVQDEQRFFSYRRNGSTGRMASLIWLT